MDVQLLVLAPLVEKITHFPLKCLRTTVESQLAIHTQDYFWTLCFATLI